MSDKQHIDDLLRQELKDFSPNSPEGVWEAVSQSIPTSSLIAAKSAAFSIKTIVTIAVTAIIATVGTLVVTNYTSTESTPKEVSNQPKSTINPVDMEDAISSFEQIAPTKPASNKELRTISSKNQIYRQSDITENKEEEQSAASKEQPVYIPQTFVAAPHPASKSVTVQYETAATKQEQIQSEKVSANDRANSNEVLADEFLKPNIPNVFTPNADGYNDEFVITIENELVYDLKIVDAKGNVVFESKDKSVHWNGVHQKSGNHCEPALYVYAFRYQVKGMKEPKVEQGFVLLKQ